MGMWTTWKAENVQYLRQVSTVISDAYIVWICLSSSTNWVYFFYEKWVESWKCSFDDVKIQSYAMTNNKSQQLCFRTLLAQTKKVNFVMGIRREPHQQGIKTLTLKV